MILIPRFRYGFAAANVPPAQDPIDIGAYWETRGDSQTAGRETEPTAVSPMTCFQIIWEDSGYDAPTSVTRDGASGQSLEQCNGRYTAAALPNTTFAWFQESGNQAKDGQRTASEFGATFQSFMEEVAADHPSATIIYESAYSFGPERQAEPNRDWDPYNIELDSRIATLAGSGITVVKIETCANIETLVDDIGYDTVCFPTDDPNAYHYQAPGNLMIALTVFDALGYDVSSLDLSGINVLTSIKNSCLAVLA